MQRELARLVAAGLLLTRRIGNQKHYQANPSAPVFAELRDLVMKTSGLADVLLEHLAPVVDGIVAAFVYGSVAKGEDTASSDIDLMVISDSLTYADIFAVLEGATSGLGRSVNPTVYSKPEFLKHISEKSAFVFRVWSQPKIWVIGTEGDLGTR